MNFKKTLSLLLAVLMAFAVVPFSGMAAEECEHEYTYTYYKNNKHVRECICGEMAFESCSGGEATCGQQAICDYCKSPYGDTPAHDFSNKLEDDEKYLADAGDCQTKKRYYISCKVCGGLPELLEEAIDFEGAEYGEHDWDDGVSNNDATCTADGTKTLSCTAEGCDEKMENAADEGSMKAHTYTEKIADEAHCLKAPTCTEKGVYYYDCAYCDANAATEDNADEYVYEVDPVEHMFVIPAEEDLDLSTLKTGRTCEKKAVFYKVCFDCGTSAKGIDEDEVYEYGELDEHKFICNVDLNDTTKYLIAEVTCTDAAIYAKSCGVCGVSALAGQDTQDPQTEIYIEGEEIPEGKTANAFRYGEPRRHSKTKVTKEAKEATCTEDGWTVEISCDFPDCGTLDKDGNLVNTVLTESEKIEKLGHDYDFENPVEKYKAPTCKQYGTIGKVECTRCKTTFAVNEKNEVMAIDNLSSFIFALEPLGHVDSDADLVCDRDGCNATLDPSDTCECICHGTGFMYFVGWILKWFWSLTGTKPYCDCGEAHY